MNPAAFHRSALILCLIVTGAVMFIQPRATRAADAPAFVIEGKEGPGKGKNIVFVSGDEEYRSEEGLPELAKILAKHHGFKCTVVFAINKQSGEIDPNTTDNLPGIEALDNADCMVILTRFRNPPDEQMKHIVDYINTGKPILGLRTATHAFQIPDQSQYKKYSWSYGGKDFEKGFGRQILGETWVNHWGHHGSQSQRGIIPDSAKDNPLLKGVSDVWGTTDVYEAHPPADVTVLLQGQVLEGMTPDAKPVEGKQNDPMMPIAWTHLWKNSENGKTTKAFCTTMGAATDLKNEGLRRLIVNTVYWGVGMEDKIDGKADVSIVGTFEPSKFGFGGFVKGKKPADYLSGAEGLVVQGK